MPANHFDQASRYTAKLDPPGFLRWLMNQPALPVRFDGWLDTRTVPFPGEPDRVCDTVAGLTDLAAPEVRWAMPAEFQTRAAGDLFGRLLEYLARLWIELRPPDMPGGRYHLVAGVVNLTGANGAANVFASGRAQPGRTGRGGHAARHRGRSDSPVHPPLDSAHARRRGNEYDRTVEGVGADRSR